MGRALLAAVTAVSALAVFFIFYYIAKEAFPFFRLRGVCELFTRSRWYPSAAHPEFGAVALFVGSGLVTLGAAAVAVPLGILAAICLSDVLPFELRQWAKPVIELLAAIPSVAYGFFALVVFAPLLQDHGGHLLAVAWWLIAGPLAALTVVLLADATTNRLPDRVRRVARVSATTLLGALVGLGLCLVSRRLRGLRIESGTNALNVSIILGIMALPTVVSVSEDALQAVGRELREGSYALGATRAETVLHAVVPAALNGLCAAVILGVMRAFGETMVVWMASGNAAQVPQPLWNFLVPIRTLTATIAGDMGEADHVTGSARYHVLFALALALLTFSFVLNLASEWVAAGSQKKRGH